MPVGTEISSRIRLVLLSTAGFAILWVVARACVQAITIDEATTYNNFVASPNPTHWVPNSNNHVLNSILMRISTSIFGTSPLTVRAGALTGALLYVTAAYHLCRLTRAKPVLQWPLFVCLVYNPMIFDFMVAARGYSLAMGFLMAGIAVIAAAAAREITFRSALIACSIASGCLALSFIANFSFALIDAGTLLMIYLWICRFAHAHLKEPPPAAKYVGLTAACTLPGLAVAAALAGSILLHFPREQLVYGAKSLSETLRSLYESSLFEVSPFIVNPLFRPFVEQFAKLLIPLIFILCGVRVFLLLRRRALLADSHTRVLTALAGVVAGALSLTVSAHWAAFRGLGVLWPKDRTGIYIVVMATLLAGLVACIPIPTRSGRVSQHSLSIVFLALASYFLLCLRIGYFKEWKWDADVDRVYSVLAYYNHTCRVNDVPVNWRYDASLNFYRTLSNRETFVHFQGFNEYPEGYPAYVLYYPEDERFISEHHLTVVYRSPTGAVIAIDPGKPAPPCEMTIPRAGIRW